MSGTVVVLVAEIPEDLLDGRGAVGSTLLILTCTLALALAVAAVRLRRSHGLDHSPGVGRLLRVPLGLERALLRSLVRCLPAILLLLLLLLSLEKRGVHEAAGGDIRGRLRGGLVGSKCEGCAGTLRPSVRLRVVELERQRRCLRVVRIHLRWWWDESRV